MIEWMKELPTEPGWYWWRADPEIEPIVRQIAKRLGWLNSGEWWPVRIPSPVEKGQEKNHE